MDTVSYITYNVILYACDCCLHSGPEYLTITKQQHILYLWINKIREKIQKVELRGNLVWKWTVSGKKRGRKQKDNSSGHNLTFSAFPEMSFSPVCVLSVYFDVSAVCGVCVLLLVQCVCLFLVQQTLYTWWMGLFSPLCCFFFLFSSQWHWADGVFLTVPGCIVCFWHQRIGGRQMGGFGGQRVH